MKSTSTRVKRHAVCEHCFQTTIIRHHIMRTVSGQASHVTISLPCLVRRRVHRNLVMVVVARASLHTFNEPVSTLQLVYAHTHSSCQALASHTPLSLRHARALHTRESSSSNSRCTLLHALPPSHGQIRLFSPAGDPPSSSPLSWFR